MIIPYTGMVYSILVRTNTVIASLIYFCLLKTRFQHYTQIKAKMPFIHSLFCHIVVRNNRISYILLLLDIIRLFIGIGFVNFTLYCILCWLYCVDS